jgi:hypothetical protein
MTSSIQRCESIGDIFQLVGQADSTSTIEYQSPSICA